MKIAFINFYSGYVSRGGETFVHELANSLSENHDVIVFQAGPLTKAKYKIAKVGEFKETKWLSELPPSHILRRLFLDRSKLRELIFTIKLLPKLHRFHPEIIIPLNSGWQVFLISVYCRLFGAKLIIAGQSGPGWDDRWNLLMKPHLFVALTNRQLVWAKNASIWKQEIIKIPNGVDLDRFRPKGKKFNSELQRPVILNVAASTQDKRVEQGIRAVAKLKQGSLLLLGNGPLDEKINELGSTLLGKDRFFHTSVAHEQMPEYYRYADSFTLCSFSTEAFGIVYLEAMASGLPCVATDDESRHEIIGNAGVYIKNPDDPKEYSEGIEQALKKKWDGLPRSQAMKFSWRDIGMKYNSAFESLLK